MGATTRVRDWEVAGVAATEQAFAIGAGVSYFMFRSREARYSDIFAMLRGGTGLAFGAGGVSLPTSNYDLPYTRIPCARAFSAEDLHGSVGSISAGGVSALVGYDWVRITSRIVGTDTINFGPVSCNGFVAGVHIGGACMGGVWVGLTMSANAIGDALNPNNWF